MKYSRLLTLISNLFTLYSLCFAYLQSSNKCSTIKKRQEWGGRMPLEIDYQIFPVHYVIIHHTAGPSCLTFDSCSATVAGIQDFHMNNLEWTDIGYNFLIGNDGNVYEGVGWHKVGAHAYGWNSKSIGIAFIGNFDKDLPSEKALEAAQNLLECGVEMGELSKEYRLLAARQVISTNSPGLKLYNEIKRWNNWSSTVQ